MSWHRSLTKMRKRPTVSPRNSPEFTVICLRHTTGHRSRSPKSLAFVESYLYLERIRFGNALRIEIADCERWYDRQIIPASVQMLVENALKHNIATPEMPLTVQISASPEGIAVVNNLQLRSSVMRSGIGLKNLQHQYALYDRRIEIESADASFTVKIPFLN